MKQRLDPSVVKILHTRIQISRETKLFNLEEVARGWQISSPTLFRYDSPQYRIDSRKYYKDAMIKEQNRDKSLCQLCPKKLFGHNRCASCTMLIHGHKECEC